MFYKVEIKETLSRTVEIDAESPEEAVEELIDMYNRSDIVLDSDDYVDTEFDVIEKSDAIDGF